MERKALIVLTVLVTLSVIAPRPDGTDATAANADGFALGQPASAHGATIHTGGEPGCSKYSAGEIHLALPGSTSI